MLPSISAISFSKFRANAANELKFVTQERGNLWLTRYGKPLCAVITMKDAAVLAAVQGREMGELMHRLTVDARRMEAAKRVDLAGEEWAYPVMDWGTK